MATFVCWVISFRLNNVVFSDDAFYDIIRVLLVLFWVSHNIGNGGICGVVGGCVYSVNGLQILNASFKRLFR